MAREIIEVTHRGDFKKTTKFLNYLSGGKYLRDKLDKYGKMGVQALSDKTPVNSGVTADSWDYEIETSGSSCKLIWTNNNMVGRTPIVILIQYGHATKSGGFVQGIDFINPAMKPIFEKIADDIWKEVVHQ